MKNSIKALGFSLTTIGIILAVVWLMAINKGPLLDALYAMLASCIVAIFFSGVALLKGLKGLSICKLLLYCVLGAFIVWFSVSLLMNIIDISLIGEAALTYDLIIGSIGATIFAAIFFNRNMHLASNTVTTL